MASGLQQRPDAATRTDPAARLPAPVVALLEEPNMTDTTKLAALDAMATPGVWEVDSERDDDASYGSGPDHGTGFHNYFIGADVGGKWKTLLDTVNSDHKAIDEEYDEDSHHAWDTIGKANAAFIVALVNAYRANALVSRADLDEAVKECERLRELLENPPKHRFWGAGEPDCPREIKAGNGELHTLRCKVCGIDSPRDNICRTFLARQEAERG